MTPWFSILNRGENRPTEIYIYAAIGASDWLSPDSVSAKDFAEAMKPHALRDLVVCLNSPGGNVWDGLAIANLLRQHKGHVETRVDGVAASIASIVFLAGKTRTMAENSMLMIHDPATMAAGKAGDLRAAADLLDKVGGQLADIYATASGKDKAGILTMMAAEKWFSATEAKDFGFATTIVPGVQPVASLATVGFKNVPAGLVDPVAKARADLQSERLKRISKEIDGHIADRRITADQRQFWLDLALENEGVMTRIAAMKQDLPPEGLDHLPSGAGTQSDSATAWKNYRASLNKFRNQTPA